MLAATSTCKSASCFGAVPAGQMPGAQGDRVILLEGYDYPNDAMTLDHELTGAEPTAV